MSTPDRDPPATPAPDVRDAPPPSVAVAAGDDAPALGWGWQPLPARARGLFVLSNLVGFGIPAVLALVPIGWWFESPQVRLSLGLACLLALPGWGAWLALKQHRYTHWLLDGDGFGLRRGRFWYRETRVPATRVQHLDLKRGPLERRFGLATLVIHTAGTRHSAVSVEGLDAGVAETLRDHLARQVEDEADDDAVA
jgi:uncharacterized protein